MMLLCVVLVFFLCNMPALVVNVLEVNMMMWMIMMMMMILFLTIYRNPRKNKSFTKKTLQKSNESSMLSYFTIFAQKGTKIASLKS